MVRPAGQAVDDAEQPKKWLKTSEGWALVNVWYDQRREAPLGSLLESLYAHLFQLRQDTQFMQTFLIARAVLDAPLQTVEGVEVGKELKNIVDEYARLMFPHTEADKNKELEEMRRVLHAFTSSYDAMAVTALPTAVETRRKADRLAQAKLRHLAHEQRKQTTLTKRLQERGGSG